MAWHICLLKSMLWGDRALAAVGLLRELSVGFACPFHCGSSAALPFLAGLALGLSLGLFLGLFIAWTFLRSAAPGSSVAPPSPRGSFPRAPRLLGYLHELWSSSGCPKSPAVGRQACYSRSSATYLFRSSWFLWLWHCDWDRSGRLRAGGIEGVEGGVAEPLGWGRAPCGSWGCGRGGKEFLARHWQPEVRSCQAGLWAWILGYGSLHYFHFLPVGADSWFHCGWSLGYPQVSLRGPIPGLQLSWPHCLCQHQRQGHCVPRFGIHYRRRGLLLWCRHQSPATMEALKSRLKYASGGDASLLVWTPPQNFIKSVVAPACYVLPIMQRAGGFLAAVPNDFLSDELLLDSAVDGHEGVLGPSKVFEALLMEEDDQNNVVTTDYVNSFLVVDILDVALKEMHEFDQTTDDAEAIVPFEDSMPAAIPKVSDAVAKVLEWVDAAITGRAHFYSAREEQVPVATPKRSSGPKKISNAALVEQMNALAAQVQLLTEMQKQAIQEKAPSSSAVRVPDPSGGGLMVSRLPGLANGLGICQTPAKAVQMVGPSHGDELNRYNPSPGNEVLPGEGNVWVGFRSILQGDHAGVEICTEAHTALLQQSGLLCGGTRLVASSPLSSTWCLDGLVIDDYFCVSKEAVSEVAENSEAAKRYNIAQQAYGSHGILGSPQKDVVAESEGKVIGAYINSSERAINRGLVTLAAPAEKRISMSFISLAVSSLSHTSDALHLCLVGGWVSMLGYRRPMMSILDRCFRLVDSENFDANRPKLVPLSRQVANELVLLSVLAPLMMTDLSADFEEEVYATDASMKMGAVCSAVVGKEVVGILWKSCKSKGAYTRLLSPPEVLMRRLEIFEEHSSQGTLVGPRRPLAFTFDFIEVYAGSAKVTKFVAALGVSVGQPIDITYSPEFDMSSIHLLRWLVFLVAERKIKSIMLEPPCTTFSIMRRPRLRSKLQPLGFNPQDPLTFGGNLFAGRSGVLSYVAARSGVVSIWETPFSSYMRHLPCWQAVKRLPESVEIRTDSCRFGSPHLKSFRFLCVNADVEPLCRRCQCTEKHLQVEGSYTKTSAVYVDDLAKTLAEVLVSAAEKVDKKVGADDCIVVDGFENQLVNEVALSAEWNVASKWTFKSESHINILEEAALLRLVSFLGTKMKPLRAVAFVDSFVCRGATAKGRSSSRSLSAILRRVNARMVAFGIYMVNPFCPTRWNVADDPSRDVPLRDSVRGFGFANFSNHDLKFLASVRPTRRWASNWIRLSLLLLEKPFVDFADRSVYRMPRFSPFTYHAPPGGLTFDATLGFPGEGPVVVIIIIWIFAVSPFPMSWTCSLLCWALGVAVGCRCA